MSGMRAPDSDLPLMLEEVTLLAGEVAILDRLSLILAAGAPTLVIGPNGAGKTTLLRLAMGLVAPTSGQVSWGGRRHAPPARRAIMFQRPVMLRRSAVANLHYALAAAGVPRAQRRSRAQDLLDLVGLSGLGDRPARRMSGGEQQRLSLARALAREPQILFLDEPAAGLDPAAVKSLEDLIAAIAARGIKIVMTTHNLGQARRLAGDIVFLHRGRLIEHLPAAGFFNAPQSREARRFLAGDLLI